MKYIIYQITNIIDEKIYVGCHKTEDIDDDYMGSGKWLKRAINKHGIENFQKNILHIFDTPEEMFEIEAKLVNKKFVERKDTYNLKEGGSGGFDHIDNSGSNNPMYGKVTKGFTRGKHTIETKKKLSDMNSGKNHNFYGIGSFKGKKHSDETKRKIGKANSIHQKGSGNSQYGTCWIYHSELKRKRNKKIDKTLLDEYTQQGWIKGRKMGNKKIDK